MKTMVTPEEGDNLVEVIYTESKEGRARRREERAEARKEKMRNRKPGIQLGGIFGKLFNKNKKKVDD
jgi:hypothetical protein